MDRGRADAAVAAEPDLIANDSVRTDHAALANHSAGMHYGSGINGHTWPGTGALFADQPKQQIRFGGNILPDKRARVRPRQPRPPRPHRHFQTQAIARDDGKAELRIVHAAQVGTGRRALVAGLRQQNRRDLRQRFDHQHARHQRRTREMPLEELLADRHVLVSDNALARFELRDRIDKRRRIAVAEPVERFWNVDRHWFGV